MRSSKQTTLEKQTTRRFRHVSTKLPSSSVVILYISKRVKYGLDSPMALCENGRCHRHAYKRKIPELAGCEIMSKDEFESSCKFRPRFLSLRTRRDGEKLRDETFVSLIDSVMLKLHSTLVIYLRCIASSYRMSSIVSDPACCRHPSRKSFLHFHN